MYCPKCGKLGAGENLRFCPKCGFRLDRVTELLANDGSPASPADETVPAIPIPCQPPERIAQSRVKLGARVLFLASVLLPLFLVFGVVLDGPLPFIVPVMLVPATVLFAALLQVAYFKIFSVGAIGNRPPLQMSGRSVTTLAYTARGSDQMSAVSSMRRIDTAEISPPASITEHTTKFLEKWLNIQRLGRFNAANDDDFADYPKRWGLTAPDTNINHRRVPNLMTFFKRKGKAVPITNDPKDYRPGDVVALNLGGGLLHIGLVSDQPSQTPRDHLIVHNVGAGARFEDVLFAWSIICHYRYFE